jgi:hypothetical protein
MRSCLLGLILAFAVHLSAQITTETVEGNVQNPDGSAFSGTFQISLARPSVVNICASPAQVVPFPGITVKATAGVFTPTQLIPTSCLSPSSPYFVQVKDAKGKFIYNDNWYIPQLVGGTVNIGTLGVVQLASGISVSVPQAVISTPSGNQSITQPSGTALSIYGGFLVPVGITLPGNTYALMGGSTSASVSNPTPLYEAGPLYSSSHGTIIFQLQNSAASWTWSTGPPSGACVIGSIWTSSGGTVDNLIWVCGSTGWILML